MVRRNMLQFGVVLVLTLLLVACSRSEAPALKEISVAELNERVQADPSLLLIDVRGIPEYEAVHATAVKRLIVHTEIADSAANLPADRETPIYLICRSGRRSGIAGQALTELGYHNVYNVSGGTSAWVAAGLPTESGRGILSPEQP